MKKSRQRGLQRGTKLIQKPSSCKCTTCKSRGPRSGPTRQESFSTRPLSPAALFSPPLSSSCPAPPSPAQPLRQGRRQWRCRERSRRRPTAALSAKEHAPGAAPLRHWLFKDTMRPEETSVTVCSRSCPAPRPPVWLSLASVADAPRSSSSPVLRWSFSVSHCDALRLVAGCSAALHP